MRICPAAVSLSRDHDPVTQVNPQTWFSGAFMEEIFLSPKQPDQFKKKKTMRASPLRTENREVFPSTWKTTSRRDSVFTAPSLRRPRAGHARPPKMLFKERRASVSNWEARHKVLSKARQQQDKWNRVHSCLWLTAPKCLVSLPNSFGKNYTQVGIRTLCITKDRVNNSNGILHCELSLPS